MTTEDGSGPATRGLATRGRAIRDTFAALGVVLGLAFVGVEIRSNTRAVQGATLLGIADQSANLTMQFATDEHLVRLLPLVIADSLLPSDLGREDQYRVLVSYLSVLRVAENRFHQVRLGTVPGDDLSQFGAGSALYYAPYLKELWPRIRENYDQEFVAYFEEAYGLR